MAGQRDANGRFVKGNSVAKGNKGNTKSKWGNQNALKHGKYSYYKGLFYNKGFLYVIINGYSIGVIADKDYFIRKEYGTINTIYIKRKVAEYLVKAYHFRENSFVATDKRGYVRFVERDKNTNIWLAVQSKHEKNVIRP